MRKLHRWLLVCCCLLCLSPHAVAEEQNLVQNGGFEEANGTLPTGWSLGMWVTDWDVSLFELSGDAYEGQYSAYVENRQSNDARFEQTLKVKELTTYRFSAMVRAEGCNPEYKGANLSVADIYGTSDDLHDTGGAWEELVFYGRTGEGQTQITLMARVGGYGSENTGKAWFDNVQAVEVASAPGNAVYLDLSTPTPESAATTTEKSAPGDERLVLFLMLAVFFGIIVVVLSRRELAFPALPQDAGEAKPKRNHTLLIGLLLAFGGRLVVGALVPGYGVDINCFNVWSQHLAKGGSWSFYETIGFCDYPPGYMYILWPIGALLRALGLSSNTNPILLMLVKLPPILCDIAIAYAIYRVARPVLHRRTATALAMLFALNPTAIVTGAAWGQVDSVMILAMLLALVYAERGKWNFALPLYGLAVMIKPQALMLGPIGLIAFIQDAVQHWKEKERRLEMIHGMLYTVIVILGLAIPFWGGQSGTWLLDKYFNTMSSYDKATVNAANLFYALGGNWVDMSSAALFGMSWSTWGFILMGVLFALLFFLAVRRDAREYLWELATLLFLGVFTVGVMMHERYIYPAVVFSLMAFLRRRDRRWLWIFVGVTATSLVNIGMVLSFEHLTHPYVWVGQVTGWANVLLLGLTIWTVCDNMLREKVWRLPENTAVEVESASLSRANRAILTAQDARIGMRRWDWILMLLITGIYAVVAFWGLGDRVAPQTFWKSGEADVAVTLDLGEVQEVRMLYYTGISHDSFTVAYSEDGEEWTQDLQAQKSSCFHWTEFKAPRQDEAGEYQYDSEGNLLFYNESMTLRARYVRVTSLGGRLVLGEIGFRAVEDDALVKVKSVITEYEMEGNSNPKLLADEQNAVPVHPSYMNSTYFDEIYHARTAYEHLHGMAPYESSHPPLGKLIMSIGIAIFGMTPFGWRFMGTLIGVLMVPVMYLLGKQILRRTRWGVLMSLVMALDMMHLTQTRIATIDSFGVFFIMLMFLCMYRYIMMSFYHQKLSRTLIPLGLSGLFMGLGIASKWIGFYAAVGLALMFFYSLYCRWEEYHASRDYEQMEDGPLKAKMQHIRKVFPSYAWITLGCAVVFFIIVPLIIYYLSYVPYLSPTGEVSVERIWNVQVNSMFKYHANLVDDHPYKSAWYTWPMIGKPMWYYQGAYRAEGTISSISAFGNPAVWWVGLFALVLVAGYQISRLYGRLTGDPAERIERLNRTGLSASAMILIGFLVNYVPWALVPRSMFIYHYFASLPFVMLCIGLCFKFMQERYPKATQIAYGVYIVLMLVLFIGFYPLATGTVVPRAWGEAMNWFKGWIQF